MDNLLSAKSSYAIPAPFVFIDRSDIPNALTFNGQYKVDDQSVDLEGSLLCAGKLLQHFHVSGKSSDLEGLTLSAFNKVAVPDRCDVESPKFIEHALHKKKWIDTENALTSII